MPRHTINRVTKQPVRVSTRKGKGNNPKFPVKRTLQKHTSPPGSDSEQEYSDHLSEDERENDQIQPGTSAKQPQSAPTDQMSPGMAQQIAGMIQQSISQAFDMFSPNLDTSQPSASTTSPVVRGQKRPAPDYIGSHL